MSFPTYPEYKDSGVEWLGAIPGHWGTVQARRIFSQVREPRHEEDEQLSATQKYGVIPQYLFMELEDQKVCLALNGIENFKHIHKNDFVISLRSFQGGIELSLHSGCVSPAYTVLRTYRSIAPKFWAYLFKSFSYISYLQSTTDGIRDGKSISYAQFGIICIPTPSLPEQFAIAAFLDHETAKIDALTAEQETLIELLKEKRQAVISHAVTKGLAPNAPMRDSGVEWLGTVPGHWDISPIKYAIRSIEQGWSPQCENFPVEGDEEWGVLKVGCVNGGKFTPIENKALPNELEPLPNLGLLAGDVLISRANTKELVGSAAMVDTNRPRLLLCDKLYRLRTHTKRLLPVYLVMLLGTREARSIIELSATGASSSMQNIGQSTILELEIPLPPVDEQEFIVRSIHKQCEPLETLIAEAQHAISLLKERRSALISAAVTGKIDVRGYAPQPEAA